MKTCTKCKEEKPLDAFSSSSRCKDRVRGQCKPCRVKQEALRQRLNPEKGRSRQLAYRRNNLEKVKCIERASRLRMKYGLTLGEYDKLFAAQLGQCAVCGTGPSGDSPNFDVDHDHVTGKVRGLLCRSCNLGLGHFKDDPVLTQLATNYLRSHKASTSTKEQPCSSTSCPS